MAETKTKRNARRLKKRQGFRIRSEPVVCAAAHARAPDMTGTMDLPCAYDRPILFAIARDEHTIFVSWNINWRCIFEKAMPVDRQVYVRVMGSDAIEQQRVAVEPMAGMHYITTAELHDSCRVEIGYFQALHAWNSIAISDDIKMPPQGSAGTADVDLATIPFHCSFERLANLFGSTDHTQLTRTVSKMQNRMLATHGPNEPLPIDVQLPGKLNLRLSEMAAARRDFEKSDIETFAPRRRAFLRFTATSPSRGFKNEADS